MSYKIWFKTEPGNLQEYVFIDEDYYFGGSLLCNSKKDVEKLLYDSSNYEELDLDQPRKLNVGDVVLDLFDGKFWAYSERGMWVIVKVINGVIEKEGEDGDYTF